ncbi:MAG: hypothetical protein ACP5QU_01600 [Anaerolineae bacterium]
MLPLYDTIRTQHFPWMNWMLILANAVVFSFEISLGPGSLQRFIQTWGLVPAHLLTQPQDAWPTFFTRVFIHRGWFHVRSNLWFLAIFALGGNSITWWAHIGGFLFGMIAALCLARQRSYSQ